MTKISAGSQLITRSLGPAAGGGDGMGTDRVRLMKRFSRHR